MLSIRISPELEDRLNRVADMYGVNKNEVARIAIGQYVGQVTGLLDGMIKKTTESMVQPDMNKMLEAMIPKMIEAFGGGEVVPANVEHGRTAPPTVQSI